ncbi:MAG: tetratricopeptide repeat protein [Alphaproteobacteria bacterium]
MPDTQPSLNEQAREVATKIYEALRATGVTPDLERAEWLVERDIEAPLKAALANILGHHFFKAGDFEQALRHCRTWHECDPSNKNAASSVASALVRLHRWDEVVRFLDEQIRQGDPSPEMFSGLCNALGHLGRLGEARAYGTLALAAKEATATAAPHDLSRVSVPRFDPRDATRNIIAFSLFGTKSRYIEGAHANVIAARYVYPGWTCRFYVDDAMPRATLDRLNTEGAQIRVVAGLPKERFGTFWRFLVADDESVDRFIVRDCDAVVNVRERVAVDEWIDSWRHFHVMRDAFNHSELVLAGLWGGVHGALPPMAAAITGYVQDRVFDRTLDQRFLREVLWPTIRQSVLTHDSQFAFGERRDFPRLGRLPPGRSVGEGVM